MSSELSVMVKSIAGYISQLAIHYSLIMSSQPVIAIFDVGKTNKKLFLFDQNYKVVYERSARFIETVDEDGDPCENIESLRLSVFDSLRSVFAKKEFDIKAINFSTYGASFVYIDEHGEALTPRLISDMKHDHILVVTQEGYLLMFPVNTLPQLPKGKGNKMINIPKSRFVKGEEKVIDIAIVSAKSSLKIYSGKRHITLKMDDLKHYLSERARRGSKLPRGFQKVDRIEVVVE